jgi:hypothetical protein
VALAVIAVLYPNMTPSQARDIVVPHEDRVETDGDTRATR